MSDKTDPKWAASTAHTRQLTNAPVHDTGIYVGPGWIRVGQHVDQPMRDGLTEEEIGKRAANKSLDERELSHAFWWFLVPALIALACAAWLFSIILQALQ